MLRLSRRCVVIHKCNNEKKGRHKQGEDRISELPDDIIVEILSQLTFKQSITTSILSRRWRNLWTFSTCLSFDTGKLLCDSAYSCPKFIRDICARFVEWVQHVLDVYQGATVEQFRIFFGLGSSYSRLLDNWVKFAIKKDVQRLELNLCDLRQGIAIRNAYVFPNMEKLNLPPDYTPIHLKSLCLIGVNVPEQIINHFLKKCHLLEELRIIQSKTTSNLKIVGTESLRLKHLALYRCKPMENLEICAPNLVSFSYDGPKKEVPLRNVPLLSELCVGDAYCVTFVSETPKHLSYISQLIKLTLIFPHDVTGIWNNRETISKLYNLKELELRFGTSRGFSLDWLITFMKAAPILLKFVIKLMFIGSLGYDEIYHADEDQESDEECDKDEDEKHRHKWLEEIEIIGFIGHHTDFELAVNLIRFSGALKKVTIDTRHPRMLWGPDVHCDAFAYREPWDGDEVAKGTKQIARKLRAHVPTYAQLLII